MKTVDLQIFTKSGASPVVSTGEVADITGYGILLLILMLCTVRLQAQNANFVRIVVPELESSVIEAKFQRINGSTLPGSTLTINGDTCKVYPTGAFAGYIKLNPGINRLVIKSVHPVKGSGNKILVVESRMPEPEKPVNGFEVEYAGVVPQADMSLISGDILQVRMKALSGCQAFFFSGKPMYELPESQTGGMKGIYQGSYQVRSEDTLRHQSIDFTLVSKNGETITAASRNYVSVNSGEFPVVAQTTGNFPYFSYGLGDDRLGGARMSYLDTLVNITLTGKTGDLYHVRLSESQSAYISEDCVRLMPRGTFLPYSLTDSWSVTGDDRYDYVKIGLSCKLPYVSKFGINHARIVVDIYGAVSNTNWITQMNSVKEIKNVYYEQPEKNVVRVAIELKHSQAWGYNVYYEGNRLVIRVKQQPELLKLGSLTIGLDAGHGGSNNGALGSTGSKEKDINMAVVRKVRAALERSGAQVVMTRRADETLSTTRRWQIWQKEEPDIVLSFHCNSIGNSDPNRIKGTSTYYKYIAYRPLSAIMYDEMLKTGLAEFGNIGSFNFLLNAPTDFPNTLIEIAFMSNPEDEMYLLDPKFQDKVVSGIIAGLERWLEQCKTGN